MQQYNIVLIAYGLTNCPDLELIVGVVVSRAIHVVTIYRFS
ncbi:hypothetical protein DSUL_60131 [Desulfovibrionales bacterium]